MTALAALVIKGALAGAAAGAGADLYRRAKERRRPKGLRRLTTWRPR